MPRAPTATGLAEAAMAPLFHPPASWNLTPLLQQAGCQPSAEISPGCARLAEWHMWFHRPTDGSI